eukprot:8100286-Karenia_brevis.AAC.1
MSNADKGKGFTAAMQTESGENAPSHFEIRQEFFKCLNSVLCGERTTTSKIVEEERHNHKIEVALTC